MRYVIYLSIISLLLSGCSKRTSVRFNTKEELINYYITSVNNKDLAAIKKAHHPELMKMITKDNSDFFDFFFAKELSRSIPPDRTIDYYPMGDSNIPGPVNFTARGAFDAPIAPEMYAEIVYNKTESSSVSIVRFLTNTKDGWFIVFPIPKQDTLVKFRQAIAAQKQQAQNVTKIIDTMNPQVHAKIVEKLKQKNLGAAMSAFKEAYANDTINAELVVKEIQRREKLE